MGARMLSETDVLFKVEVVLYPNKMQFPCILEFIYLSLLRVPAHFSQSNARPFSRIKLKKSGIASAYPLGSFKITPLSPEVTLTTVKSVQCLAPFPKTTINLPFTYLLLKTFD